jgi:hypothetical protein
VVGAALGLATRARAGGGWGHAGHVLEGGGDDKVYRGRSKTSREVESRQMPQS